MAVNSRSEKSRSPKPGSGKPGSDLPARRKSASRNPPHDGEALGRAGKLLHDEIGPLLSAAGLRLQLLSMDFPETREHVAEVTAALDEAIDRVRALSRQLGPAPDYSKSAGSPAPPRGKR